MTNIRVLFGAHNLLRGNAERPRILLNGRLQSHSKEWSSPSANCAHAESYDVSAALTRTEGLLGFTFSTHPSGPQWISEESGIHKKGRIVRWFLNENNWDPNAGCRGEIRDLCVNTWCLPSKVKSSRHGDCTKEQVSESCCMRREQSWSHGSAVKNTCYSSRPRVVSHHPPIPLPSQIQHSSDLQEYCDTQGLHA